MTIPLLDGYSALEMTETPAGAFCARLLADLGCDVVKVEPPDGDPSRRRGAFPGDVPDDEASGAFLFLNENKRGITLDLTTATGAEIAARLAARSDVVIEDLERDRLAGRGLGYEELSSANPRLVMVSIAPFRRSGPHCDWKGQPLTTSHAGGQAAPSLPGRAPVAPGRLWNELQCGLTASVACLAALVSRETLGGQHVDVSKQDALASLVRAGARSATRYEEPRAARGLFGEVDHPRAGALHYPALPFTVSEETPRADRPAPLLGEHNAPVLEELGFDERATALLVATGVI